MSMLQKEERLRAVISSMERGSTLDALEGEILGCLDCDAAGFRSRCRSLEGIFDLCRELLPGWQVEMHFNQQEPLPYTALVRNSGHEVSPHGYAGARGRDAGTVLLLSLLKGVLARELAQAAAARPLPLFPDMRAAGTAEG